MILRAFPRLRRERGRRPLAVTDRRRARRRTVTYRSTEPLSSFGTLTADRPLCARRSLCGLTAASGETAQSAASTSATRSRCARDWRCGAHDRPQTRRSVRARMPGCCYRCLITVAGTPATRLAGGTSCVTTAPAATTASAPMFTPGVPWPPLPPSHDEPPSAA